MIQLKVIKGARVGTEYLVRHLPLTIGRASSNALQIQEPGIWDRHAEIRLDGKNNFVLAVQDQAMATVNDLPATEHSLVNGDRIGLGSTVLQFSLSPTSQRNPVPREVLTWLTLALLALGQIALIYWLPG